MTQFTTDPLPAKSSNTINTDPNVRLTDVEKLLLEQAYQTYAPSTVRRKLTTGKSGAEIYLIERNDQRLEIAKFDHPYGLKPELKAYNELVTKTSPEYRVELRGKLIQREDGKFDVELIQSDDGKLGVLIYNFLGRGFNSADNSLLEYYKTKGSAKTVEVLDHLFEAYGPQWWDDYTTQIVWYSEEYDRLLPVHLTLKRLRRIDTHSFLLSSGQIEWNKVGQLKAGQVVQIQKFEITECRDDVLRLSGRSPQGERSTDLRIKLEGLNPDQYQPGVILEDTYAEIIETRAELLKADAKKATVRFTEDGNAFILNRKRYLNPLHFVDAFLKEAPRVKSSIIHGDLNLRNIMVHESTGFAWLIDFAHTRKGGPTLFDLQRLEDHVIAEILVPAMQKAKLKADVIIEIFESLHGDSPKARTSYKKLQEPYTVLLKIRELAKQYLPKDDGWQEYYRGLFIVSIGALKYKSRTAYHCDVQLVTAAHLLGLLRLSLPPLKRSTEEPGMLKLALNSIFSSLFGAVIVLLLIFVAVNTDVLPKRVTTVIQSFIGATLTPQSTAGTPTAAPTMATPEPTLITGPIATTASIPTAVLTDWPPQYGTILARVRERGFLICGIAGDVYLFSNKQDTDGADTINLENSKLPTEVQAKLYDEATGFETDFCRALAVAIFGEYEGKVAFLDLAVREPEEQTGQTVFERFVAVEKGIVDVAFRNTTWNMRRSLRVNFGPIIYYDSLKFMLPALPDGSPIPQNADDAISYLKKLEDKICVLGGTTTVETLEHTFGPERIISTDEEGRQLSTNDQLVKLYLADECKIIASDESQLISQQAQNSKLIGEQIIPINQGIAFEPLAPFIVEGDNQWHNILTHVIWNVMYAEQVGINSDDIEKSTRPNGDANIPEIIRKLIQDNPQLQEADYKALLGIQGDRKNEEIHPILGIRNDYLLQVISQLGNYGEIFARNITTELKDKLGRDFPRKFNCVWNPLERSNSSTPNRPENECRLVLPPP